MNHDHDHDHRPGMIDARTGPHLATCRECGRRIRATSPGSNWAPWVAEDDEEREEP